MNIEKYTERARGFIQSAQSLAMRDGHQQFSPLHMLKVLLDDSEGLAGGLIDRAGGHSRAILKATEDAARDRFTWRRNWRARSTPRKRPPRRLATALSRSSGCCSG
jgi:ATP-dependent Clp protease ATP-binding subunit ClpA